MHHELEVVADPDAVSSTAAAFVARQARACVQAHGRFTFAVSGGHTPWAMFARLAHEDVPWERVAVLQVDERVAPDGDPDRNLTHLRESLGAAPAEVIAMPVNDTDLEPRPPPTGGRRPNVSTSFTWASARTGTPPRWCHGTRCSKSWTGQWP
ncbi:6-phosphogluconolactonase [Streptomyces sp. NBC_01483]|uniref:6-phosphogluconolactonase n=1 Tax=Streptomyces sp. NBC_01483 TaxID=2903883 RepID=UPI002E37D656|nr:6-phosphogluconolactonase [Streptomyces sp. NBC_01483]